MHKTKGRVYSGLLFYCYRLSIYVARDDDYDP